MSQRWGMNTGSKWCQSADASKTNTWSHYFQKGRVVGSSRPTFRQKQQFFMFVQRNKTERFPLFTEQLPQRCFLARPFPCTAPAHLLQSKSRSLWFYRAASSVNRKCGSTEYVWNTLQFGINRPLTYKMTSVLCVSLKSSCMASPQPPDHLNLNKSQWKQYYIVHLWHFAHELYHSITTYEESISAITLNSRITKVLRIAAKAAWQYQFCQPKIIA